jgi:hypothetical protein
MIFNVVTDLSRFLLFYAILVVFMSNFFAIIGLGNFNVQGKYRTSVIDAWQDLPDNKGKTWPADKDFPYPEIFNDLEGFGGGNGLLMWEYLFLPKYLAYILSTFNVSLGNFDFAPQQALTTASENQLYWVLWLIVLFMTNIIFLNFIIAEASESYARVKDTLDESISKERASMVNESESMVPSCLKQSQKFPRYLISRTVLA